MKLKLYITLVCSIFIFQTLSTKDQNIGDTSMALISDIADITDDLASLIITCKHDKNPEAIKALLISLLRNIAKTSPNVKQLVDTIKASKQKKSIHTNTEELALEQLADTVLYKVCIKE